MILPWTSSASCALSIFMPAKMGSTVDRAFEAAIRRAAGYVLFGMSLLVLVWTTTKAAVLSVVVALQFRRIVWLCARLETSRSGRQTDHRFTKLVYFPKTSSCWKNYWYVLHIDSTWNQNLLVWKSRPFWYTLVCPSIKNPNPGILSAGIYALTRYTKYFAVASSFLSINGYNILFFISNLRVRITLKYIYIS